VDGQRYTGKKTLLEKIHLKPSTRQNDTRILKEAMRIRDVIEFESRNQKIDLFRKVAEKHERDLILYMGKFAESYEGNTRRTWDKAIKHVKSFFGNAFPIEELTRTRCREFAEYLKRNLNTNSANTYFQKFKQTLKRLLDDQVIEHDLASGIIIPKKAANKHYLTLEEIKIIVETPINDIHVKNAFLFSCFTGLRVGDLQKLMFSNIKANRIDFTMEKTKDRLSFNLPSEAVNIIEQQRILCKQTKSDFVFPMGSYSSARAKWKRFFKYTSIDKNITFHCGRHTFGTLCVTSGIDIFTISKLMGHKDVKVTQVYLKLLDEKKDEAVKMLPELR